MQYRSKTNYAKTKYVQALVCLCLCDNSDDAFYVKVPFSRITELVGRAVESPVYHSGEVVGRNSEMEEVDLRAW